MCQYIIHSCTCPALPTNDFIRIDTNKQVTHSPCIDQVNSYCLAAVNILPAHCASPFYRIFLYRLHMYTKTPCALINHCSATTMLDELDVLLLLTRWCFSIRYDDASGKHADVPMTDEKVNPVPQGRQNIPRTLSLRYQQSQSYVIPGHG